MSSLLVVLTAAGCACGPTRAGLPDAATPRCHLDGERLTCLHQTTTLAVGGLARVVHWQLPVGAAPAGGWPAVVLFQGSFLSASLSWSAQPGDAFGAFFQTKLVQALLEHGYAVLTPETKGGGVTYWDTNIAPFAVAWTTSPDHALMVQLFDELDAGTFGPVDTTRLYAAGISSGGYMTSRMADAYPGKFRALAIESAAWCSCGGPACVLPATLPAEHPPTLFLHGEQDLIVPISTARDYDAQLRREGHESRFVSDAQAGHEWLEVAPAEVLGFFDAH